MAAAVSIPEKTLEHWSSQYVTYRYRAHAGLWWPTRGADIDVRFLPRRPGKAFQIELKTTYFGQHYHDVNIDLGQLTSYWISRHASRPFYAFPWPDWYKELEPVAVHHGVEPTSMGFSRSGRGWWFADWMVALTIDDVVCAVLPKFRAHIASHRAAGTDPETRGALARLVRFRPSPSGNGEWVPEWGNGTVRAPTVIRWRELWTQLQRCGDRGWPQWVQLPAAYIRAGTESLSHADVHSLLVQAGEEAVQDDHYVWLESTNDGVFEVFDSSRPLPPRDLLEELPSVETAPDDSPELRRSIDDETPRLDSGQLEETEYADAESMLERPKGYDAPNEDPGDDHRQLTFLGAPLIRRSVA